MRRTRQYCILLFSRLRTGRSLLFLVHGHAWYLDIYPSVIPFPLPFTPVEQYAFFLIIPYYPMLFHTALLFSYNAASVNHYFAYCPTNKKKKMCDSSNQFFHLSLQRITHLLHLATQTSFCYNSIIVISVFKNLVKKCINNVF